MGAGDLPVNKKGSYQKALGLSIRSSLTGRITVHCGVAQFHVQDVFCAKGGAFTSLCRAMPTCQGIARCAPAAVASPSPCGCRQAETGADAGLILQNCLGLHSSLLRLCRGSCGEVAGRELSLVKHKPSLLPWAHPGWWELVEPDWGWQQRLSRDACRYLGCVVHLPLLWAGQS